MTAAVHLGIDAGTSGCKVLALDDSGRIAARARVAYEIRRGHDGSSVADVASWTAAVAQATRECVTAAGGPVAALSITAPAHYVVLLGAGGEPLAPMMIASDRRPARVAAELAEKHGDQLFRSTWSRLSPGWSHAQLAWLNRHDPALMARVRTVLPFKDYLRFRLTGDRSTDPSDAAGTGLWSQRDRTWELGLLEDCGLRGSALPDVTPALSTVATTSGARSWGLRVGTPVAVGATDTAAELFSLPGRAGVQLVKLATTGTAVSTTEEPRPSPTILTYPHVEPGLWYHLAVINTAASLLGYLAGVFGRGAEDIPRLLLEAEAVPPGADGLLFLPYLDGERTPHWNEAMRGSLLGLTAGHGRGHIVRAALEGVAMAMATNADLLTGLGLWTREPAWLTGGGADSPLWSQILAAALDQELRHDPTAGPARGAALIARQALGAGGVPSAAGRTIMPDATWVDRYRELRAPYAEATQKTETLRRRRVDAMGGAS